MALCARAGRLTAQNGGFPARAAVDELLKQLAVKAPGEGWRFKLDKDAAFLEAHGAIAARQVRL
jgi:hypothetical protein